MIDGYENHIRKFREKSNMTQQELAERLGTTVRSVRRWENGEIIPDVLTGVKISKILGVKFSEIFDVTN